MYNILYFYVKFICHESCSQYDLQDFKPIILLLENNRETIDIQLVKQSLFGPPMTTESQLVRLCDRYLFARDHVNRPDVYRHIFTPRRYFLLHNALFQKCENICQVKMLKLLNTSPSAERKATLKQVLLLFPLNMAIKFVLLIWMYLVYVAEIIRGKVWLMKNLWDWLLKNRFNSNNHCMHKIFTSSSYRGKTSDCGICIYLKTQQTNIMSHNPSDPDWNDTKLYWKK